MNHPAPDDHGLLLHAEKSETFPSAGPDGARWELVRAYSATASVLKKLTWWSPGDALSRLQPRVRPPRSPSPDMRLA